MVHIINSVIVNSGGLIELYTEEVTLKEVRTTEEQRMRIFEGSLYDISSLLYCTY